MNRKSRNLSIRLLATGFLFFYLYKVAQEIDAWFSPLLKEATRISYSLLATIGFVFGVGIIVLLVIWKPSFFIPFGKLRGQLKWFRWLLIGLLAIGLVSFFSFPFSNIFGSIYLRLLLVGFVFGFSIWLAADHREAGFTWAGALVGGVLFGTIFALGISFREAVNYPFSLGWSEGNLLWEYSLLYGRGLYGYSLDEKVGSLLGRGRQSLWGLPFLFGPVSIALVRFWSAFIFTIPYILLGFYLFVNEKKYSGIWVLLGLWSFLFLSQGPIYTPLVLAAILVAFSRRKSLWISVPLVALAGYYAQMSRSTWLFAPAMWAVLMTFLDPALSNSENRKGRWLRSIVLGLAGLLGGYLLPEVFKSIRTISNSTGLNPGLLSIEGISSKVSRQPLLWSRLFPNATSGAGILFGLILAAGPLLSLVIILIAKKRWRLDVWQKLALAGILGAFLVVGVVISVKIGGGNNLHNLDMFLIGTLFATSLSWEAGLKQWVISIDTQKFWLRLIIFVAVLYPAMLPMINVQPFILPPKVETQEVLNSVQKYILEGNQKGEVLLMDQRQLLTFGFVQNIPMIPDYEKRYMMDMAMADEAGYFNKFYKDLADHRFSMIITEPLHTGFQGSEFEFGNENDAWVKWVSIPLLCYYEPVETYPIYGVQVLVPKRMEPPVEGVLCPTFEN